MSFGAQVIGTGVFISTIEPQEKMVKDYISFNRIRCKWLKVLK